MTRELTADVIAAIRAGTVKPALFIFADFPNGAKRLWSGKGTIPRGGFDWVGVGGLMSIRNIAQETVDTSAKGIQFDLDGVSQDIIDEVVSTNWQGRECYIDLGFFNVTTFALHMIPNHFWKGRLDTDEESFSKNNRTLQIKAEHRMVDILRKREIRYTHEHQQMLYPGSGDTGFIHIESIIDVTVPWGRTQK